MHIRLIAVGDRQPSWVDAAVNIYTGRFPPQWKFRIDSIATAKRSRNTPPAATKTAEGEQILNRVNANEQVVLLDERGKQLNSQQLADALSNWQADGRDLCFIIGGPDGISALMRAWQSPAVFSSNVGNAPTTLSAKPTV